MGFFDRLKKKPKKSNLEKGVEEFMEKVFADEDFPDFLKKTMESGEMPVSYGSRVDFRKAFKEDRLNGVPVKEIIKKFEKFKVEKENIGSESHEKGVEEFRAKVFAATDEETQHQPSSDGDYQNLFQDVNNPTFTDVKRMLFWIRKANECSLDEAKQILLACEFDLDAVETQRKKINELWERIFHDAKNDL